MFAEVMILPSSLEYAGNQQIQDINIFITAKGRDFSFEIYSESLCSTNLSSTSTGLRLGLKNDQKSYDYYSFSTLKGKLA